MSYNILVTGAKGQLGRSLRKVYEEQFKTQYEVFFTDIEELDITNKGALEDFIADNKIDIVINAAAYTAVDKAETDKENAFLLNQTAVRFIAELCQKYQIFLIHISTDYVFDGTSTVPYTPEMTINPLSVYGKSKAEGEREILERNLRAAIVRTSWLYSPYGTNFVKTMLRLGNEKERLNVINDQVGAPTNAKDLATAIFAIINKRHLISSPQIFHYANEGTISWYDFAREIMTMSNLPCVVQPIRTEEYPTAAQRPQYSIFDLSKIKTQFALSIPFWKDSLKRTLQEIKNNES